MMHINNMDIFFSMMEGMRFNDLKDIKRKLKELFSEAKIDLSFKSYAEDDYFPSDYEIVVEIKNEGNFLIDLDLYFLYDRRNMILITEFNFEVN